MPRISPKFLPFILLLFSCTHHPAVEAQKISQFEQAGMCDLLVDKSGVYHAVFQESTAYGKPMWIYYSTSSNHGASWSKPITLSNDNTGNGAGYPRLLQDGSGRIYAIWKRYGTSNAQYPVTSSLLDGPGGIEMGTIYYKVLSGGTWSQQIQVNENEWGQDSWCACVAPNGSIVVLWFQCNPLFLKSQAVSYTYCDYLRATALNGTSHSVIVDLTKPSPPANESAMYPAEKKGGYDIAALVDKDGKPHLIYETTDPGKDAYSAGTRVIKYYDGKSERIVYSYPGNASGNSFDWPPRLLSDEKGVDHLIFMPANANLEDQQIWDLNLLTNQTNVLQHLPESVGTLESFQASQGPNGQMAVVFEMSMRTKNTEAYGLFYKNGTWTKMGLTKNASKNEFMSRDFIGLGGWPTNLTTSTTYNSRFASVAYGPDGKKSMLMNLVAHFLTSAFSTDSPSIIFLPIDK